MIEVEEEKDEYENTQKGAKIKNKENKLKDDDFVPRRIIFSDNPMQYAQSPLGKVYNHPSC